MCGQKRQTFCASISLSKRLFSRWVTQGDLLFISTISSSIQFQYNSKICDITHSFSHGLIVHVEYTIVPHTLHDLIAEESSSFCKRAILWTVSSRHRLNQSSDLNPVHSQEQGASTRIWSKNSGNNSHHFSQDTLVTVLWYIPILFRLYCSGTILDWLTSLLTIYPHLSHICTDFPPGAEHISNTISHFLIGRNWAGKDAATSCI